MNNEENVTMESLLEGLDNNFIGIKKDQIIKGRVILIKDDVVFVNISYMADGIIPLEELSEEQVNPKEILNIDDEIYVYVLKLNDGEGNVLLSKVKADRVKVWDELEDSYKENKAFEVTIDEVVNGGVITRIKGQRAFIPASQISASYIKDLSEYVGKNIAVKIIELDKENKKIVLSGKEIAKAKLAEEQNKIWAGLEKGQKRKGVVKRLERFGAFVDIGGVEGLVHISELSWNRINDPSEVVNVGDNVEVYVLDLDRERGRISLALKDIEKDPWNDFVSKYKEGDVVEGKVIKLLDFGAFVEVQAGVEGLVHISEISEERINRPSEKLEVNQTVKVKVLKIDEANKKLSLSIKEAVDKVVEDFSEYKNEESGVTLGDLFGNKFN